MSEDVDWVGRILLFFALIGVAGGISLVSALVYGVCTLDESAWVLRWLVVSMMVVFVSSLLSCATFVIGWKGLPWTKT